MFGRITVKGPQQVETLAIRRKITVREGDLYSANKLTESADAIYGLGTFQAVTPRALNLEAADEPLDIEIEVRERSSAPSNSGRDTVLWRACVSRWSGHIGTCSVGLKV